MDERLCLIGFEHSVYTWAVRLALDELGLQAEYVEANPFADPPDPVLAHYTALDRVPVLQQGDWRLTETGAILRYLEGLADISLRPDDLRAAARMDQVIGLVDADVYPILVRQVFSNGYYAPVIMGLPKDQDAVDRGLLRAEPVLETLDAIAREGLQLSGTHVSLADLMLAPMMRCFMRVPGAPGTVARQPALDQWWQSMSERASLIRTDPFGALLE